MLREKIVQGCWADLPQSGRIYVGTWIIQRVATGFCYGPRRT